MKVVIVGGVAGGASCAARLRRLDEQAEILMVEKGPYVSYANCGLPYHISGVIPKESSLLVANEQLFRNMFNVERADQLRGDRDRPEAEDRGPARRHDRGGDDRALRQAGALPGRAVGSPAAPRHRSPRHLPRAHRAGRADHPRVDRAGHGLPGGALQLLRHPVREADAARGRDRRRVHRARDGGEPGPRRVRGDARRDARPGAGAARSRVRAAGGGAPQAPRHQAGAGRWRGRVHAGRGRRARGEDEVRHGVSGRRRHPRARVCGRIRPWRSRPGSPSASAAASAWTIRCARAIRTSSRSATPSR